MTQDPHQIGKASETLPDTIKRVLPWLVAVAFFMESLDTTILNTAVPTISKALAVTPLSMKSVLASYTLSLAVFIPISGWMADRFGTKRVFAAAIATFTAGSVLCGLSANIHLLVACRILQGCGGAMMVPVGRLTLVRTFARSELIRAMSFVAIPSLIGPMLGPLAGGFIVAYFNWRAIFFINLPIGLIGLCLVYWRLPDYRAKSVNPLDLLGLILFGSGVALLSYVLEIFGEHALATSEVVGLLGISLLLLFGYGLHATKTAFPLLDMTLFKIRTFSAAVGGSFITRLGIGGAPFLLPLLYQVGLGYTPVQSGLLIMPQAIASMSIKAVLPKILAKLGYRTVLISNTVAIGLVLMLFGSIGAVYAFVADRHSGLVLWRPDLFAVHQHEHAGVCRCAGFQDKQCKLPGQHRATTIGQLWRCGCRPDDGLFHPRQPAQQSQPDAGRHASGVFRAGRVYNSLDDDFQ